MSLRRIISFITTSVSLLSVTFSTDNTEILHRMQSICNKLSRTCLSENRCWFSFLRIWLKFRLFRAMFWHTDDNLLNVDELVEIAPDLLNRTSTGKKKVSAEDYALLEAALRYV